MINKILVMGLPGSGKTTLSLHLAKKLHAVRFNADEVRRNINKDLGFSVEDRIEQARRMSWLCDQVTMAGHVALADFICPTEETREAFNADYIIWVDTIYKGRFEDTNLLFEPPTSFDFRVTKKTNPEEWAKIIYSDIKGEGSVYGISLGQGVI